MAEENIDQCPECASWNVVVNEMKKQIVCRDCGGIFTIGQAGATAAIDVKVMPSDVKTITKHKAASSKPAKKASAKKKPKKSIKSKAKKGAQGKKSKKGKRK